MTFPPRLTAAIARAVADLDSSAKFETAKALVEAVEACAMSDAERHPRKVGRTPEQAREADRIRKARDRALARVRREMSKNQPDPLAAVALPGIQSQHA